MAMISYTHDHSEKLLSSPPCSKKQGHRNLFSWIKGIKRRNGKTDTSLREAIEEYIDEPNDEQDPAGQHEQELLSNILKLRNIAVVDVMIPRADIVAIEVGASQEEVLDLLAKEQYSRLPVYQETLDRVLGTIHIKDVLGSLARGEYVDIRSILRDIPVVSPAMPALDLILEMQKNRRHMAMVVDEYGGIDGLVTIGDIIETIVGEIDDEHDTEMPPQIIDNNDGTILVDARLDLETFENNWGHLLTNEERQENDTLGGLICHLAGRVPTRGEILSHSSGLVFEVLEADPRRVHMLKIRQR